MSKRQSIDSIISACIIAEVEQTDNDTTAGLWELHAPVDARPTMQAPASYPESIEIDFF